MLRPKNEDPVKMLDDLPLAASLLAVMVENIESLVNIHPEASDPFMQDSLRNLLH